MPQAILSALPRDVPWNPISSARGVFNLHQRAGNLHFHRPIKILYENFGPALGAIYIHHYALALSAATVRPYAASAIRRRPNATDPRSHTCVQCRRGHGAVGILCAFGSVIIIFVALVKAARLTWAGNLQEYKFEVINSRSSEAFGVPQLSSELIYNSKLHPQYRSPLHSATRAPQTRSTEKTTDSVTLCRHRVGFGRARDVQSPDPQF